ncbi:FRG domain-containing protein [Pseudomonas mandelii]|uniref:FRG domain-containing protein n=1 Tax=Pseudomonas mandelii TaxID=75612 RepID=A0AB36D101_9PSED|nr:FRG domain-containing protein [Pseudomonas mandelii]NMZ81844.1 FRG domain-containing protein [Pseudomonas mandelii]
MAPRRNTRKETAATIPPEDAADDCGDAPGRLRTITVNSTFQYLNELEKLDCTNKMFWYRGIGNVGHDLIPSLFRHKTAVTKSDFSKIESDLNETFRMRSFPYTESFRWLDGEWDQLFFMQHYRVPTRLLDWSGSPLVSLHFALTSARTSASGEAETDAAVWVLDPVAWNRAVYHGTRFDGTILSPKDSWLNRYTPKEVYDSSTNVPPVAMRGSHNSARIVAQQGFFTIFGPEKTSMERIFMDQSPGAVNFSQDCLMKIIIPKSFIKVMKKEMFALGVSESTIYPDLEGLSFELKRTCGF